MSLGPIVFLALVPWIRAAFHPYADGSVPGFRRQFRLGYLGAFTFFACLMHWLLFLSKDEVTIPGIMVPAIGVLAGYLALYFGLAFAMAGWAARRTGVPPELCLPFFWLVFDWARSAGESGFPWGNLGYALARYPAALQVIAWTGFSALAFWILLVNGVLALATRRGARARPLAFIAFGLAAAPWIFGAVVVARAPARQDLVAMAAEGSDPPRVRGIRATLLQANTAREIKWKVGYRKLVVEDLLAKTSQAAERYHPDLVVWPETAAPVRIPWEPELATRLRDTFAGLSQWVLVGTLDAVVLSKDAYEDYNAALLYGPDGEILARYFKEHLVPFGEITPWKRYVPFLANLDFGQSEFTAGRDPVVFEGPRDASIRCLICFESIFSGLARDGVRGGARYLVNITNDFWYGRSAGPIQHAEMAIPRAVETRTPLLRCANSGVSFFVDAYGRVSGKTGLFEAALPTADLQPGSGGSFFVKHGDWGIRIAAACSLLLLLIAALRPRKG